ncbi:MAG: hypothetical protein IJK75_02635 [Bacteroidales bacterium]|nr:hypothetical protein [Bacteroidales bacterium]
MTLSSKTPGMIRLTASTTTGFATQDTTAWPPLCMSVLIICSLICGCSGSTSGGEPSSETLSSLSLLINHPGEELLTAFSLFHPMHFPGFIIGNALTDFSIQCVPVDERITL